jgi:nitroreductase
MTIAADPAVTNTLARAATRAALAPSVHNTQPWRFVVTHDTVEIRSDFSRQLTVLDPRARQLTISCGCALFNARVAIAAAGFEPVVARFPDPEIPDLLARVSLGEARDWVPIGALDQAVDDRRTNRRAFADEAIPASVIYDLVAAARSEFGYLIPITTPEHRAATAELSGLAERIQAADPAYLAELRDWTTDDPRRGDGVQAATVPYAGRLSDAHDAVPIRPFDVRGQGWLPSSSHSDADQCLLLLASLDDGPESWLRTGEALERVWLELTRLGYAASPLSQLVEVAQTHERLRASLQIDLHPEILLRVGLAPDMVQTPRRRPDEVISSAVCPN